MRVSLNWLRTLVKLPENVTTKQIADGLTRMGLQVETIEKIGDVSGPVLVGKILDFEAKKQSNGKTIRWCQVDVGEDEPRGIICGASNFAIGDLVVVSLPGAVLPGGFEISARKTYGHISDGMICAADELGIGQDHSGIIVLGEGKPGDDAMALLNIPDEVFEIDVTPDLGCYAMSMRGIAREVAQACNREFNDPYDTDLPAETHVGYPVRLETDGCSAFAAISVNGLDPQAKSPSWMSTRLNAAGMRSISLAVDITNYVMLESGQPLHAYDADHLQGTIVVRQAKPGETLVTLDDVTRKLSPEDVLITDDSGPIGLAGVMGGQTTELVDTTTNILLEGAHFSPKLVGRTFRRHKLPSEASTRFARTVDPNLGFAAAMRAAQLMAQLGGATIKTEYTMIGQKPMMPKQRIDIGLAAKIIGMEISDEKVLEIFTTANIDVVQDGTELTLTPPSWRADLVDAYDYIEEIARKVGMQDLVGRVPRAVAGHGLTKEQKLRRAVNKAVAQEGYVEVLTLPFIGDDEIINLGLADNDDRKKLLRLANPLSETQPYLRTTLLPGLFAAVNRNISRSQTDLAIFENGSVFPGGQTNPAPMPLVRQRPNDDQIKQLFDSTPKQPRHLAAVLTGNWLAPGWNNPGVSAGWQHALALAEIIGETVGIRVSRQAANYAPWHPGRCAQLLAGNEVIGYAGELHPKVIEAYGLPKRSSALEIDLDLLFKHAPDAGQVDSLSPFPLTKEDVALIVDEQISAAQVEQALVKGAGQLLETIRLFDIYRGEQIGESKKSLAFALGFRHPQRTLNESEAIEALNNAVAVAKEETGAIQRI